MKKLSDPQAHTAHALSGSLLGLAFVIAFVFAATLPVPLLVGGLIGAAGIWWLTAERL